VAGPYYAWKDSGFDVTLASIRGGAVPIDPASLEEAALTPAAQRFRQDGQ
jgi:putative intracellular protease/amidase